MFPHLADMYKLIVVEDRKLGNIVGAGSVILEKKFIRNTAQLAHIEDIVVDKTYRGKNLGLRVIETLMELSKATDCYKITLDCAEHNVKFYERCGFSRIGVQMAWYRDGSSKTSQKLQPNKSYATSHVSDKPLIKNFSKEDITKDIQLNFCLIHLYPSV